MQPTATEHDSQSYTSLSAGVGCSFFPLIIEGQLAELSAFVVSKNGSVVVTLSVNSIRSSSTVHCTSPLSNNQDFNSSFPIPSMQHFATNTSMMACDQPLFVMLRHQQSSIKLFAVKSGVHTARPAKCVAPTERYVSWMIRFTATTSVQIFLHLATEAHQIAFCLKTLSIRLSLSSDAEIPRELPDVVGRTSAAAAKLTVLPSQIKMSFESALVRCDSENIAVFKVSRVIMRNIHSACHLEDFCSIYSFLRLL
ncbi:hypothetical protein FBUS_00022 [Fasciolopsis buskii]|uniref:Uncharacterized protein n=1 Tax=Fasciolopsis buskii TaxID=27845 RepID=A0A8E0VDG0_9TREM|nr:hypothetical protein FBUS_00022 [Fasciolopsis buski]